MQYVDLGKTVEKHQQMQQQKEEQQDKKSWGNIVIPLVIVLAVVGMGLIFSERVRALFNPVSIVSTIASPNLEETDGRTNILLMGVDKRAAADESQSVLTDTLLFVSIGRVEKNVAMISLPRDLWVEAQNSYGTNYFAKINSVYAYSGVDELVNVTEEVLGMPIHYYGTVDFEIFKETIDILGGIEVDVENEFDDYQYPVEGMEDAPVLDDRYEHIHFDAGTQMMDGETALKYVRSRKGDNNEGTDFARSKRQQKVIWAIKDKVLSIQTLIDIPKLKELYDTYSQNVETNIGFEDVQGFYLLSQQIDFDAVRSIVLDDRSGAEQGGLLYHPSDDTLYGGAYVLVPRTGDYAQLHAYVQRYIFGE